MSIVLEHFNHTENTEGAVGTFTIKLTARESTDAFKEMVRRALNVWPEAHPELKELGDLLDHGRILQDYWASRTDIYKQKRGSEKKD